MEVASSEDPVRRAWRWLVPLLLIACGGGNEDSDSPPTTTFPTVGCDERQAWPIDDKEHQVDRIGEMWNDVASLYWIPDNPRGLVVMLHGSKQSAATMTTIEHEEFYNELARRDIGYLAVSSVDPDWATESDPSNVDVQRISDFRDVVISKTALEVDTPVFAVGFSGGAGFAPRFGDAALQMGWDFRGFAGHNNSVRHRVEAPAAFIVHENDNRDASIAEYGDQAALGAPSILFDLEEIPLEPMRFTRSGASRELSQLWFDEAVTFGLVDVDGNRLTPVGEMESVLNAFAANSEGAGSERAKVQFNVIWRRHIFSADAACDEASFFAAQLD